MSITVTTRLLLAGLVLVIAHACAKESSNRTSRPVEPPDSAATSNQIGNHSTSGNTVRAYIDPKTGELREPTPDELAAQAAADAQKKQAAAASPQADQNKTREILTPSGAVEIQLDKSSEQPLRACIDPQGNLKMDHECEAKGDKQ